MHLVPALGKLAAMATAMVVFPTPPLPMVMMSPLPGAARVLSSASQRPFVQGDDVRGSEVAARYPVY